MLFFNSDAKATNSKRPSCASVMKIPDCMTQQNSEKLLSPTHGLRRKSSACHKQGSSCRGSDAASKIQGLKEKALPADIERAASVDF